MNAAAFAASYPMSGQTWDKAHVNPFLGRMVRALQYSTSRVVMPACSVAKAGSAAHSYPGMKPSTGAVDKRSPFSRSRASGVFDKSALVRLFVAVFMGLAYDRSGVMSTPQFGSYPKKVGTVYVPAPVSGWPGVVSGDIPRGASGAA